MKTREAGKKNGSEEITKSFEIDTEKMKVKFGLTFIKKCFKISARFIFPNTNKTRSFTFVFGEKTEDGQGNKKEDVK